MEEVTSALWPELYEDNLLTMKWLPQRSLCSQTFGK